MVAVALLFVGSSLSWSGANLASMKTRGLPGANLASMKTRVGVPNSLAEGAYGSDRLAASADEERYFWLAPWEKMPDPMRRFGRPTTLDLRGFIQPFNRSGAVIASVLATQEGLPALTNQKIGKWRIVGAVAARDKESLPLAIARQRPLIEAWTKAFVCDLYQTDEHPQGRPLITDDLPIRIGWCLPPDSFKNPPWVGWPAPGEVQDVPEDTPIDAVVDCGFFGSQCRAVQQKKGGTRFVQVEIP